MAIPAALAMAPAIAKGVIGAGQFLGGLFKRNKRPTMRVPDAQNQALNIAKRLAAQKQRPGRTIADENINRGASNAVSALKKTAGSASDIITGAASISQQANRAMRDQDVLDMQYGQQTQGNLQNALGNQAAYQQQAWAYNEGQKFEEDSATKSALLGGGLQNIVGAGTDLRDAALLQDVYSSDTGRGSMMNGLNRMFGNRNSFANRYMQNRIRGGALTNQEIRQGIGSFPGLRSMRRSY